MTTDEIRVYGLGYFGSRNIELEFACHAAIVNQSSDGGFFFSAEGRELLARSDEFSAEFVVSLRQFTSASTRSSSRASARRPFRAEPPPPGLITIAEVTDSPFVVRAMNVSAP